MLLSGAVALVLYLSGRKTAFTEIEKKTLEEEKADALNAKKAQEEIDRRWDEFKDKVPNSWSNGSSRSSDGVRKPNKS